VRIDLQRNLVTVTPARRRMLDLASVPGAIERAGFRPEGMRIVATGSVESDGPRARFRIQGWPVALPIVSARALAVGPGRFEAEVDFSTGEPRLRLK